MLDPKISAGFAGAVLLWLLGFSLIVAGLFGLPAAWARLGIGLCCGGAVLMIRSMMCRSVHHLEKHLENMFEIGRDVGRLEAIPRPRQPERIH